jgi:hypothetical protein
VSHICGAGQMQDARSDSDAAPDCRRLLSPTVLSPAPQPLEPPRTLGYMKPSEKLAELLAHTG